MRIIHIWERIAEGSPLVSFCGRKLSNLPITDLEGTHYAIMNVYRDEFVPDLCEECLEYDGAQMILLAGTKL